MFKLCQVSEEAKILEMTDSFQGQYFRVLALICLSGSFHSWWWIMKYTLGFIEGAPAEGMPQADRPDCLTG